MATILDTFITRFGFDTDTSGLDKAKKGMVDFKTKAMGVAAAIGSVLAGSFVLVDTAMQAVDAQKFADGLGIAVDKLDEMDFVAQSLNVSIETLRGQAFNLTQALNEAAATDAGIAEDLKRFGLSAKDASGKTKNFVEFVDEVRIKMQQLSAVQRADLADKLFFDEETIALLTVAPGKVAELTAEARALGVISRRDSQKAQEFMGGIMRLGRAFRALKFELAGLVFKPLADFFNILARGTAFIRRHSRAFKIIIATLAAVGIAYVRMGVKAALAWVAALGPTALVIAAIAGVATTIGLLGDDLAAFFAGEDSLIGDAVKKWPVLGDVIFAIRDAIVIMGQSILDAMSTAWEWSSIVGDALIKFVTDPVKQSAEIWGFWSKQAVAAFETVMLWAQKIKDVIIQSIQHPLDTVLHMLNKLPGVSFDVSGRAAIMPQLPPSSPVGVGTAPNVSKTSTIKIDKINVNAAGGDSREIAENINSALRDQLKNTVEDLDSGISR